MQIAPYLPHPPRPIGPPDMAPVDGDRPEKPDKEPKGKGRPEESPSDVVDVKRYHGRLGKRMAALTQLVRDIRHGEDVPEKEVEQALHQTEKIAEFIEEKSKLPEDRKGKILARLERYANVFKRYLAGQEPEPKPVPLPRPIVGPRPIPIEPEQIEHLRPGLPTEGVVA